MIPQKGICAAFALILGCVLAHSVYAKVTKLSLREMVARSELIVIARVIAISDTGDTRMGYPVAMVRVSVQATLKGSAEKSLDIYEIPTAIETARFSIYDRSVLFLTRYEGKLWVVQGFAGNLNIIGDDIKDIYMSGEEVTQPAQRLLEKIGKFVAAERSPPK